MTHRCHALACNTPCQPERLMCLKHWRMVPKDVQRAVWNNYRAGQCDDKEPSEAWHEAADLAIVHVAILEGVTMAGRLATIARALVEEEKRRAAAPPLELPEGLEL